MVPIAEAPPIEGLLHLCIYYLVLIEGFVTKTYLVLSILQEKARVQKIQGLPARTTPGKFKALQSTGFPFFNSNRSHLRYHLRYHVPTQVQKATVLSFFQLTIFHRAKLQLPSCNTHNSGNPYNSHKSSNSCKTCATNKIFVNQVFRNQQSSGQAHEIEINDDEKSQHVYTCVQYVQLTNQPNYFHMSKCTHIPRRPCFYQIYALILISRENSLPLF